LFASQVEEHLMIEPFNHVLKELDFGTRSQTRIRSGNSIESMEGLILARSDLAFGQLNFINPYDQLRLFFVTEWVGEFGLGNNMLHFQEDDFNRYLDAKLELLAQGNISITPSFVGGHSHPWNPVPAILSALTSENRGFARQEDYDDIEI
jgi:hypothetical protein